MNGLVRKSFRVVLGVVAGLFSLPSLLFGFHLVRCSFRIHTSDVYYVQYPYVAAACVLIGLGLLSVSCAVYGIRRRSFYGLIFVIPLAWGFATLVSIPDATPHAQRSMMDDANCLSDIRSFFEVWYKSHHSFPKDEGEFRDAMRQGPAAWQFRVASPASESDYAKNGERLPYKVVVINGAIGPKLDRLSERPGVIYYCVSADYQQFWATMTGSAEDIFPKATLKRVGNRSYDEPWLVAGSGKAITAHNP
ncbi:MAG: hypothetical protein WBM11_08095 [Terriglobales bacterium]